MKYVCQIWDINSYHWAIVTADLCQYEIYSFTEITSEIAYVQKILFHSHRVYFLTNRLWINNT